MQVTQPRQAAGSAAPTHVIRYVVSFDGALDAGRLFQARFYRWYVVALIVGLLAGVAVVLSGRGFGLSIVLTCATLLLMAHFAVMDRMFGRRKLKSLIGGTTELVLSNEGIAWTGPLSSGHMPWMSITEVRANRRTVLFVGDRLLLAYAPAASFVTSAAQAEVVAYSRRQVAAARANGPPTSSELGASAPGDTYER